MSSSLRPTFVTFVLRKVLRYVHFTFYPSPLYLLLEFVLACNKVDLGNNTISNGPNFAHDLHNVRDDSSAMSLVLDLKHV